MWFGHMRRRDGGGVLQGNYIQGKRRLWAHNPGGAIVNAMCWKFYH